MSFTDQQGRRSPASIAAVVLVHAAIGYAFYAGLAVRFLPHGPDITETYEVPPEAPPPPERRPLPPRSAKADSTRTTTMTAADPVVRVPTIDPGPIAQLPTTVDPGLAGEVVTPPPRQPPRPGLANGAEPIGDRARWVTEADYPAAALRAGVEGIVGIAVTIGIDGRVAACVVTQGSGDATLDDATCRTYARRARFRPALDETGKPTPVRRDDRVRWQVPRD